MKLSQLKAIQSNADYTLCAYKPGLLYVSHERGIAPIMRQLACDPAYFKDCMIVDRIIGKAAAMLYHRSHVAYIHACLMSESAKSYLQKHRIAYTYDALCPYIINRTHTGMCPMEECVKDIDDVNQAYTALAKKLFSLQTHTIIHDESGSVK